MHQGCKAAFVVILWATSVFGQDSSIPPENTTMPKRDAIHDFDARAKRLLAAIDANKPDDVKDLFFPSEAFAKLKEMKGAMAYYDKLVSWFLRPCAWKKAGSEYNKIPYWSCYRNKIIAKDAKQQEVSINVKTLINWGDEWYVTHFGPIPKE